jgi:hydroxymethylbilane synthase
LRSVQLKKEFLIGARGSPLSLAQSTMVGKALEDLNPGLKVRVVPIKTSGDDPLRKPTGAMGVKGLFVKEIEEALLDFRVDLAVHSAKDLPATLPSGLVLGATPERALPFDALITDNQSSLLRLPKGARVGTSSLRRSSQLLALRSDFTIIPIRGNLDTRINKVKTKECDAVILAASGLVRLKGKDSPFVEISPSEILPAPGQGILALELRESDPKIHRLIEPLNHMPSKIALISERAFMKALGAGCQTPAAAWARFEGDFLVMDSLVAELDGTLVLREEGRIPVSTELLPAEQLGTSIAEKLLKKGGSEIIAKAEREVEKAW